MDECITYIGLDVHKETIAVALAEGSGRGEVCAHGQISNTPAALSRLSVKLSRPGSVLRFCYEAGPCGYGIQRQLAAAGHDCVVVAPSLIPRKPGDRIKTDRRDAINLAKLHRADALTTVWIPDPAHDPLALGQFGDGCEFARLQHALPPERTRQGLHQPAVGPARLDGALGQLHLLPPAALHDAERDVERHDVGDLRSTAHAAGIGHSEVIPTIAASSATPHRPPSVPARLRGGRSAPWSGPACVREACRS